MAAGSSSLHSTNADITSGSEIRLLPLKVLNRLSQILDIDDSWKELLCTIPDPNTVDSLLFCAQDIRVLEEQKQKTNNSPTLLLLHYWGTFGKNRPSIQVLLDLLMNCRLYRAAHYLTVNVLCQAWPITDDVDISLPSLDNQLKLDGAGAGIPQYDYVSLEIATRGFCTRSVSEGGNQLGEGAFGTVFLAQMAGRALAVKKIKECIGRQFETEIQVLSRFEHPNLLPLLGYSVNGPSLCLIYEYLSAGSLELCLADLNNPIGWTRRLLIALGAAKGINHLHVSEREPLVHRDIKSANILLDTNLVPKLGDFGLARSGSRGTSTTAVMTNVVSGTNSYMAPEAFRGDVSTKMDVYSYGIVLLELLTGLPPYDPHREGRDLLSHVQELCGDTSDLLDGRAGLWNPNLASSIYQLSVRCTQLKKKERPTMAEVVSQFEVLCSSLP